MITMMNTEHDYINQIKEQKDAGYSGKFIITFKRPVQLIHNKYHRKTLTSAKVKLFFSGNMLCYTFYSRTGYSLFRQINADDIVSIEKVPSIDKKANRLKQAESLLRRIDARCWDDIRNRTPEQISEEFSDSNLVPFNFIKRFRPHIQHHLKTQLIDAFENRKTFYYVQHGTKRDLSVEAKVGSDGVFRAWFSSEYAGCLNGDYYLVISPTQAIYYERD